MGWVFSDDPNDWATQIGALATGAAAVFTGVYVWLTYRLVAWTSETAAVALHEARYQRIARLLPARILLDTVRANLNMTIATPGAGASEMLKISATFSSLAQEVQVQMSAAKTLSPAIYNDFERLRVAVSRVSQIFADAAIAKHELGQAVAEVYNVKVICTDLAAILDKEIEAARS